MLHWHIVSSMVRSKSFRPTVLAILIFVLVIAVPILCLLQIEARQNVFLVTTMPLIATHPFVPTVVHQTIHAKTTIPMTETAQSAMQTP